MISDIEDYFAKGCGRCARFATSDCATSFWASGLTRLRNICLSSDLKETVKWGHPCYVHAHRNIAIIGAFRDDFRLSFFHAGLMTDPASVLEKQGPNTRHPDMIRFTSNAGPVDREAVIRSYLDEAKGYAEAGTRPPKENPKFDLPEELVNALNADAHLSEAFHALTPGRQRSYVIALSGAKTTQTRVRRIEKLRDKIRTGKGANER